MGGIEEPYSAYNNFCCIDAARKVYSACERLRIQPLPLRDGPPTDALS